MKFYLRQIAYIVIGLLLVNTGLSAATSLRSVASNGAGRVLLCTADGFKWVVVNTGADVGAIANEADVTSKKSTQSHYSHHCFLCLFNSPIIAIVDFFLSYLTHVMYQWVGILLTIEFESLPSAFLSQLFARAPPASF